MNREQVKQLQMFLNSQGANLVVDGIYGPKTKSADLQYNMSQDPYWSNFSQGDLDNLMQGMVTGDWSKVPQVGGKPFDSQMATNVFNENMKVLDPAYQQEKMKDTGDVTDALEQKQADYGEFLRTSGQKFQDEKTQQDQTAADQGVLFSGARVRKLEDLKNNYQAQQDYKRDSMGRDISSIARGYESKFGEDAAGDLSKYYKLGGNTFNPNTTINNVGSSGLSRMYRPEGYYGTNVKKQQMEGAIRSYGQLQNQTNKSMVGGYKYKVN